MRRRFKNVWLKQEYHPSKTSKTVYFLNHNFWWDGLIPLFLNEHLFKQQARALMEDKQMKKHKFFQKIGAFSINLEEPKSNLISLRYALKSLERPNAGLFIYPEGKLTPASDSPPNFKGGLAWLYQKTEGIDFVPIHIYSHFFRGSKPELYFSVGKKINSNKTLNSKELTALFENEVHQLNLEVRKTAGLSDQNFKCVL